LIDGGLRIRGINKKGSTVSPLVSIITVTKNSAAHVEKTINSILNQTYINIEYIIIDGESNDDTINIIRKYEDKISYWLSEKDKNLYDAMNKGINNCTGDIVGIVNSDDWLEEDAVEAVVRAFLQNPSTDLVHGNLSARKENGELECVLKPRLYNFAFYISLPFYHPTCFLKKRTYYQFGVFNINYSIVADYEFILRIKKYNVKMLYLDKVISNMSPCGMSDRAENFKNIMKESLQAKLANGYDPLLSRIGLWIHLGKSYVYRFLKKWNLDVIVKMYRLKNV
jgi:glycosyltransferase involved in cell wall biosynthesis